MSSVFKNEIWCENNFKDADFKDKRLSNRLMRIANAMAQGPERSIPKQMGCWKDIKGCYGFLRNQKVSHKRIQTPHREYVKKLAGNEVVTLFIQDTSEIDYSNLEATEGLGYIGNHQNKGIMFHSCLAIKPVKSNPKVLGLAHQQVWERKHSSLNKNETRHERNKRSKESDIWLKNLRAIGSPTEHSKWVSIGDRANDIFEFFDGSKKMGWESVVRVCQNRNIEVDKQKASSITHIRTLESRGSTRIKMRKQGESKIREIDLKITWEEHVVLQAPARIKTQSDPVVVSVIRCWNEEEKLEWILYSSIKVTTLEQAIEKVTWYSMRWIVEEYHKCLKTGCSIESRQLQSGKGLERLLGILGVIGILMLQLRNEARENKDTLASELVEEDALQVICSYYNLPRDISINEFCRSVARLGGFIGRKSDGEPGWQTLWEGWIRLLDMLVGYNSLKQAFS
jgi:hypothetical protein